MGARWLAAGTMAAVIAVPAAAGAAEVITAEAPRESRWRVEAGAAYAAAGVFDGWGLSVRTGRVQGRFMMVGLGIESIGLHAEGTVPMVRGVGEFSQSFRSTLAAGFVRGQLPMRFVTPYAELALGFVVIGGEGGVNYQCRYHSGSSGGVALGADAHIVPSLSVGLRGGLRMTGAASSCNEAFGPYTFEPAAMTTVATTVAYRW